MIMGQEIFVIAEHSFPPHPSIYTLLRKQSCNFYLGETNILVTRQKITFPSYLD